MPQRSRLHGLSGAAPPPLSPSCYSYVHIHEAPVQGHIYAHPVQACSGQAVSCFLHLTRKAKQERPELHPADSACSVSTEARPGFVCSTIPRGRVSSGIRCQVAGGRSASAMAAAEMPGKLLGARPAQVQSIVVTHGRPHHLHNSDDFWQHTGLDRYPKYMVGGGYVISEDVARCSALGGAANLAGESFKTLSHVWTFLMPKRPWPVRKCCARAST